MPMHTFTFALEVTVNVEAESREEACIALVRATNRDATADLWEPSNLTALGAGQPAKGIMGAHIHRIDRIS